MNTTINVANCDIYLGQDGGKKVLSDIKDAKKSLKIVSPYLSPSFVDELVSLHFESVNVRLLTTDKIKENNSHLNFLRKLIKQHRIVNDEAEKTRNKWIDWCSFLLFGIVGYVIAFLLTAYFYSSIKLFYGIIPLVIAIMIRKLYQEKILQKRIFDYKYESLFPFKVFISPTYKNYYKGIFLHSKIYIIDDQIAYLGSLNFTESGMKYNYETIIKITDQESVDKIIKEFNDLFFSSTLPNHHINLFGKELFAEEIN